MGLLPKHLHLGNVAFPVGSFLFLGESFSFQSLPLRLLTGLPLSLLLTYCRFLSILLCFDCRGLGINRLPISGKKMFAELLLVVCDLGFPLAKEQVSNIQAMVNVL